MIETQLESRIVTFLVLAALQAACSTSAPPDRYANCTDLGTLALPAFSRLDAEQRMRARVEELGGDTLLFGERGRSALIDEVPAEIAQRRDELGVATTNAEISAPAQRPVESIGGAQPLLDQPTEDTRTATELWYHGAALRCKATAIPAS
jgi:hypothetical protein